MVRLEAERDAALLKAGLTRADLAEHVAAGSGISAEEERALRAQPHTNRRDWRTRWQLSVRDR